MKQAPPRRTAPRKHATLAWTLLLVVCAIGSCAIFLYSKLRPDPPVHKATLVFYAYHPTDPAHHENFQYFLSAALQPPSNCQYIILISSGGLPVPHHKLPKLPKTAQYVFQPAQNPPRPCSAWGLLGWFLQLGSSQAVLEGFQSFVLVSSGVRGPFMPVYMQHIIHWTEPLIR
jgi:hypothetical protein